MNRRNGIWDSNEKITRISERTNENLHMSYHESKMELELPHRYQNISHPLSFSIFPRSSQTLNHSQFPLRSHGFLMIFLPFLNRRGEGVFIGGGNGSRVLTYTPLPYHLSS